MKKGYILEHRYVMEQKIGRLLLPSEVVHHRDGNTQNNHPDNLELFESNAAHMRASHVSVPPPRTPEIAAKLEVHYRQRAVDAAARIPDRETLAALYAKSSNCAEIGRVFGVYKSTVQKWLRHHGIVSRRGAVNFRWPETPELSELVSAHGVKATAASLGCDPTSLYDRMAKCGIPLPKALTAVAMPDKKTIESLYATMTCAEIGKMYGVSPVTAVTWLKRLGIKARRGGQSHRKALQPAAALPPPPASTPTAHQPPTRDAA